MKNEFVALSQELHDGIAQDLVGLGFSIDNAISHNSDSDTRSELRAVRVEIHRLRKLPSYSINSTTHITFELNRVFNEISRNVEEHSKATSLSITVTDNGIGGAIVKDGSFGLVGIQERVKNLRGETLIESDQNGTKIVVTIPLDTNDSSSDS